MSSTRSYRMSARAEAVEATRDRVVEAARAAFESQWYDDVTLRGVAADAGVALQTVVNHFGTKEALYGAASERSLRLVAETRWQIDADDLDGALEVLLDGYERDGDSFLRSLAVEERIPVVRPVLEQGRRGHEEWVATVFAAALDDLDDATRARRLAQLVVVTDVYTWKLLRRDRGMSRDQVLTTLRELVLALLPPTRQNGDTP